MSAGFPSLSDPLSISRLFIELSRSIELSTRLRTKLFAELELTPVRHNLSQSLHRPVATIESFSQ
jgi:hypothetical protein